MLQGALRTSVAPWLRVGMVCGTVEENLANNRRMAAALTESGHAVSFAEFRDGPDPLHRLQGVLAGQ